MKKSKPQQQNKLIRIITIPIRALAKARDFYVKSMNSYADKVCNTSGGWSAGPSYVDPLPRSFSTASARSSDNNDDDFKELVRAASTSKLASRIDLSHSSFSSGNFGNNHNIIGNIGHNSNNNSNNVMKDRQSGNKTRKGTVPRSASVGMAKIEEDKPIEFGEISNINYNNNNNNNSGLNKSGVAKEKFRLFPRSKSYAVGSTKRNSAAVF